MVLTHEFQCDAPSAQICTLFYVSVVSVATQLSNYIILRNILSLQHPPPFARNVIH